MMILFLVVLAALAVWGLVATIGSVVRDGYGGAEIARRVSGQTDDWP